MSQSPSDESEFSRARSADSAFRQSLARVNRLLQQGRSLSGHERNCAFLNLHNGQFATISAVSGFDWDDDARALALSDWDHDGDVDVWITNRTGPRVRFLQNNQASAHHYLAIGLKGTTVNRDAIGARVSVVLADQPDRPLIKTLRAGEGYLAQSSKWLHFGLGDSSVIDHVQVLWPDGTRQRFIRLKPDQRYLLVQGEPNPRTMTRGKHVSPADESPPDGPSVADAIDRARLTQPIPLPRLAYQTYDQQQRDIPSDRPLLITLWASWCQPCLAELQELGSHEARLRQLDLNVLALCVDPLVQDSRSNVASAQQWLQKIRFPFLHGVATDETLRRIRTCVQLPFAGPIELAVPSSLLVDTHGHLCVIYHGAVGMDQLEEDVRRLSSTQRQPLAGLPLSDRWNELPPATDLLPVARELVDRGHLDDAAEYVRAHGTAMQQNKEFGKLLVWLGDRLAQRKRMTDALEFYERALQADSDNVLVLNNVAWQLATNPDEKVRSGTRAIAYAERAAEITGRRDANILSTLAASYAEGGQFSDAVRAAQHAIDILRQSGQEQQLRVQRQRLELYQRGLPYHQP